MTDPPVHQSGELHATGHRCGAHLSHAFDLATEWNAIFLLDVKSSNTQKQLNSRKFQKLIFSSPNVHSMNLWAT